jgi:hypothetical protein
MGIAPRHHRRALGDAQTISTRDGVQLNDHSYPMPQYVAGDSRRTRLNTSGPCCCQSSARSSRKRLLNARRVASGEPRGGWYGLSFGQIGNGHGFGPLLCSEAATIARTSRPATLRTLIEAADAVISSCSDIA